jgi:hypothetical protein
VTQSTISAIKHGRLHPEAQWPNGDIGPLPYSRDIELTRLKRMGMLRRSEIATGRGHIKDPTLQMPVPHTRPISEKEQWMRPRRLAEKNDGSGELYSESELEELWLIEAKERQEIRDAKEREEQARYKQMEAERLADERSRPPETDEERERWESEKREEFARRHLWDKRGKLIHENLLAANFSKQQILELVETDPRAKSAERELREYVEAGELEAAQLVNKEDV